MATIRELARHCGVSVATVSRVFNTPEVVSRETRQRVEAAATEIGYLPNESARTLATKKSNMIGLVWDTDHRRSGWRHPFLQEILVALKTALSAHGLHLLLLATGADEPDRHLRAVRRHNLDGVVMIDNGSRDPAVLALADAGIPCVALDLPLTGPCCTFVTSDNAGGARQAVDHLVRSGHHRIATIAGPARTGPGTDRLAGFRAGLAAHDLPLPPEYVVEGDFYLDSGRAAMRALLLLDTPPTAVFAAGDEMAIGALQTATEAGLRVPADIAIVGFDDIELAALIPPGLTTIAQDRTGFGTAAAEALIAMIQAGSDAPPPVPIVLPTSLARRGTA
ncbi:LacI family transcriptional regulator [Catenuloplanes nepalensis]|uniref:LacI family transcriptional regulator n=1 Tax=Catenuloplanes nepalensis TaxID=587533 RepID=A0ABT9MWC4_9ACTN|nr:LacI family DNA-binding transcriptional regulator [Catenuloplanes nepalensis]MDP9795746.1 LacI family transcriptional regulator [Catenuloplanes nepalensis]